MQAGRAMGDDCDSSYSSLGIQSMPCEDEKVLKCQFVFDCKFMTSKCSIGPVRTPAHVFNVMLACLTSILYSRHGHA